MMQGCTRPGREGKQMRWLALLVLVSLVVPLPYADESTGTAEEKDAGPEEWLVGKNRDEVVATLGPPSRMKRRKGVSVMLYKFGASGVASHSTELVVGRYDGIDKPPTTVSTTEWQISAHAPIHHAAGPVRRLEVYLDCDDRVTSWKMILRKPKKTMKKPKSE